MQHEMKGDFLRVHHFLDLDCELLHVSILVLSLHDGIGIEARGEGLGAISTLPLIDCHDTFGLVVDVEDRSGKDLAIHELESTEHGNMSKALVIDLVIVVLLGKPEIGLTHNPCVQID